MQEPFWTSVRGVAVKTLSPAKRGRRGAPPLEGGEHTRTLCLDGAVGDHNILGSTEVQNRSETRDRQQTGADVLLLRPVRPPAGRARAPEKSRRPRRQREQHPGVPELQRLEGRPGHDRVVHTAARPTAAAHRDRASTSSWPPSGARRKARWTPRSTKRTTRNGPSTRSCYEQRGREPRKRAFCGRRLPDGYKPDERGLRRRVAHRARLRRTPPTARSRGRTPTAGRTRTPRSVCTPPPDYDIKAGPGGRAGSNESRGRTDPRPIRPDRIANAAFGRRIARIMYNNRGHPRVPKKFQKKIRRGRHRSVGNPRSVRRPQGNSRGRGSPRTRGTGARPDDGQNPNG